MSDRISSPFSSGLSQLDRSPQGNRTSSWLDSQSRHPSSDLPQESSASPSPVALTQRPHLPSNSRSFLRPFQGAPSYTTTPFTATSPVTMPSSSSSQPSSYPAPHRSPASRHLSWNQRRRLGARAPDSPSQVEEIDLTRGLPPSPASGLPLSGSSGSRASGHLYGEITPSSSGSRLNPEAPAYLPLRPPAPPADLPAEAGPSTRAPSMRRISSRANPIEVLDDSDEDDVVFLRSRQTQPQPQRFPEVSHSIRAIDVALSNQAAGYQALIDSESDPRRSVLSPPPSNPDPPAPRPTIRLGGAVRTNGGSMYQYRPPAATDPPGRRGLMSRVVQRIGNRQGLPDRSTDLTAHPNMDPDGPTAAAVRRHGGLYETAIARAIQDVPTDDWGTDAVTRLDNGIQSIMATFRSMTSNMFGFGGPHDYLFANGGSGIGSSAQRDVDMYRSLEKCQLDGYGPQAPSLPFMSNFDTGDGTIEIDDNGLVIERSSKKRRKPCMACANCSAPLLISSAYRRPDDRIVALRCAHMIDTKCLKALCTPTTDEQLLSVHHATPPGLPVLGDEPPSKRQRKSSRHKSQKLEPPPPPEYVWTCPVDGCGTAHVSVKGEDGWEQKEGLGAQVVYA